MLFDFADISGRNRHKSMGSDHHPVLDRLGDLRGRRRVLNAVLFSFQRFPPGLIRLSLASESSIAPPGHTNTARQHRRDRRIVVCRLRGSRAGDERNRDRSEPEINELREAGLTVLPRYTSSRRASAPSRRNAAGRSWSSARQEPRPRPYRRHARRDDVVLDAADANIDTPKLKPIGRMHGTGWCARTSDLFEVHRIPVAEWKR